MTARRPVLVLVLGLLAVAAGCGRKGRPIPPVGRGPLPPASVSLRQLGDELLVTVAAAPVRRDGRPLRGPVAVEILLLAAERVETGSPWEGRRREHEFVQRAAVITELALSESPDDPGRVQRVEGALPRERLKDIQVEASTLVVAARLRDGRGRKSDLSARETLSPLAAPAPPVSASATPLEDRIALRWDAPQGGAPAAYHVYRRDGDAPWPSRPLLVVPPEETKADDRSVAYGARYTYGVRAAARSGRPYVESVSCEAGPVDYRDVFPPPPPEEVGVLQAPAGLRVVWFPGRGAAAARYRVQRADADGPFADVATVTPPATDWTDAAAVPGRRYRYRVVAEDELGNASEPSSEAAGARVEREGSGE